MFAGFEIQRIWVIDKNVLWGIPATETHVEPTHKRDGLVDNAQFLVLAERNQAMNGEWSENEFIHEPSRTFRSESD